MAGEQVSTRRFGGATELGVRALLKGTMRAVQLSADPNQVLAGTLRAGDHVDLVANMSVGNTNGIPQHYDRIFLRNLLVLRAPTATDSKTGSVTAENQTTSVMLAVTDSQSTKLMFILRNSDANTSPDGGWALELRPVTNAADSPENVESLNTVLVDGLSAAERSRVAEGH